MLLLSASQAELVWPSMEAFFPKADSEVRTYGYEPQGSPCVGDTCYPTVVFHGFGDACGNDGMAGFTRDIASGTGTYAECVEIGNGASSSIYENF